ncbi:MAG: acyl-CoA dehydrogenase family protein [Chloroflexota bacterium]
MDFRFTREQEEFRNEVRTFLEEELKQGSFQPRCDAWIEGYSPEFSRKLSRRGWIGLTWPREYGGGGKGHIDRLILTEELLRYGAPCAAHWFADRQVGPCLLAYGSEQQKREYLPRIIAAEMFFGLALSEPEAGSDLASLKTSATEKDDCFVLNGQKVWTSGAHHFTHCYVVARTDPQAPKHRGISEFVVDMKLPGITVRPLIDLTGERHFNEVFFDEVRVPRECLIGGKNRGWYQITVQLDYERSGMERVMGNYPLLDVLLKLVTSEKGGGWDSAPRAVVRHKLAELAVEFEVGRLLVYRVAAMLEGGRVPNYETAMAKLYATEYEQRLAQGAMEILGLYGQLSGGSRWSWWSGKALSTYLFCRGYTLMGGTSEILRNVIAMRGLGLPSK